MKKKLIEILEPFSLGQIADTIVLMRVVTENGYGVQSLQRYVDLITEMGMRRRIDMAAETSSYHIDLTNKSPKCENCGKTMHLFPVNNAPGNQIGGTAQSMWACPDMLGCGFYRESDATMADEYARLGVRQPAVSPQVVPATRRTARPVFSDDSSDDSDDSVESEKQRLASKRRAQASARRTGPARRKCGDSQ